VQEGKPKGKKNHLKKKPKRPNNAADDETCRTKKKAPHLKRGISRWVPLLLPSSFFFQFFDANFFAISPPNLEILSEITF